MSIELTDVNDREAVLAAYEAARRAGRPPVDCYRAGVAAWRRRHPEHAPDAAARRAVGIILATYQDEMLRVD
jgi:hypothetical protein